MNFDVPSNLLPLLTTRQLISNFPFQQSSHIQKTILASVTIIYHSLVLQRSITSKKKITRNLPPGSKMSRHTLHDDLPNPSNELSVTLTEFTLFPRLPIEIRLTVYSLAQPGSRRVQLIFKELGGRLSPKEPGATRIFPALLLVNKETRQETLKTYYILSEHPTDMAVYINFKLDTLYFGPDAETPPDLEDDKDERTDTGLEDVQGFLLRASGDTLQKVERLALGTSILNGLITKSADILLEFPGLMHFTELYSDSDTNSGFPPLSTGKLLEAFVRDCWDEDCAVLEQSMPEWKCPTIEVEHVLGKQEEQNEPEQEEGENEGKDVDREGVVGEKAQDEEGE
jgi:hypothetical protein